jgi:glycosyltransferase involved in cell wall biosynthesis
MRIVILTEHFTPDMGYIENKLPSGLARLGQDVHVISSGLQANHSAPDYETTFEKIHGPKIQKCGTELVDGFTLHRIPHKMLLGHVQIPGLAQYLRQLKPDIVQVHATSNWIAVQAGLAKRSCGYLLFTGAHQTASIFSSRVKHSGRWSVWRAGSALRRALPGRIVSWSTEKCYAATSDCRDIAVKYYGVPAAKVDVCSLGVDTEYAFPVGNDPALQAEREDMRLKLGFRADELVCIYTGKLTDIKNPLLLARAVAKLRKSGQPFRGLFVGEGAQAREIAAIDGCVVRGFVPARELPAFYRASEIGVWPAYESMSMLDAAGCGIPVVVNHTVAATERWEGNGLTYHLGEVDSLVDSLRQLCDPDLRHRLGEHGARKVAERFSWLSIARIRLQDYETAMARHENSVSQQEPITGAIVR